MKYKPNKSDRWLWPLIICFIVTGVSFYFLRDTYTDIFTSPYAAICSFTFAVLSKIFDSLAISAVDKEKKEIEKKVRCQVARDKINFIHSVLRRQSQDNTNLVYALTDLESILNSICHCCDESTKVQFVNHRNIIGSTKAQLQTIPFDSTITFDHPLFITNLQNINTTLLDN